MLGHTFVWSKKIMRDTSDGPQDDEKIQLSDRYLKSGETPTATE